MIILDASVLVSGVLDDGPEGAWALGLMGGNDLLAPDHLLVESHSVLRRLELSGVESTVARTARRHIMRLPVELVAFETVADRVWELRGAVTAYDAAYVAVAELSGAPLATLDRRLTRAPGTRCGFLTPPTVTS